MLSASQHRRRVAGALALGAVLIASVAFASPRATRRVSIAFRPVVGAVPFACGQSYKDVGVSKVTLTPSDFAMFVYDLRLVGADGRETAITLDQDSMYQSKDLALLDFEDGTGPCSNGNAAVHTAVTGTVPDGSYVGLRFTIGVPFDRNHLDLTASPSPLSLTRMFWAWNSGHKFVRFDAKTASGKNWVVHLGSTGCTSSGSTTVMPTSCAQGNRVNVALDRYNPDLDVVVADAGALLEANGSTGDSSQVCMSSPKSAACAPVFAHLGLPFNGTASGVQAFLRAQPAAADRSGR